jgi:hypothetical protein
VSCHNMQRKDDRDFREKERASLGCSDHQELLTYRLLPTGWQRACMYSICTTKSSIEMHHHIIMRVRGDGLW